MGLLQISAAYISTRPLALLRFTPAAFRNFSTNTSAAASSGDPEMVAVSEPSTPKPRSNGRSIRGSSRDTKARVDARQLKQNWLESLSCPWPDIDKNLGSDSLKSDSDWVIGVDPDLSGALAVLKPDNSPQVYDSPLLKVLVGKNVRRRLDVKSIIELLKIVNAPIGTSAYIEQSIPYPKDVALYSTMSSLEEPLGLDKLPSLGNMDRIYRFSANACQPIREDMGSRNCWIEGRICSSSNSCIEDFEEYTQEPITWGRKMKNTSLQRASSLGRSSVGCGTASGLIYLSDYNDSSYHNGIGTRESQFKKFKFLKSKELAAGFLSCFFVGFCLALFLSILDYRVVSGSNGRLFLSGRLGSVRPRPPEFLETGGGDCDVFRGDWVWDESYPLYEARDCTPLGRGFRCNENGRPDASYAKWRWQPKDCNLPRFTLYDLLSCSTVQIQRKRNQWESLLCMLSSAVPNKTSIYEVNGNPISKHMGSLIFMFKDYNCTVEYHRSPFLVFQGRPPRGAHAKVKMTIRVDKMEWRSSQWKDTDLLVLNTGQWWNRGKTVKLGCYFQEVSDVKMETSSENALIRSMETLADWVNREVNLSDSFDLPSLFSSAFPWWELEHWWQLLP